MKLTVIARIESLGHTKDEALAAIGQDQHFARVGVECNALDLARVLQTGQCQLMSYVRRGGFRICTEPPDIVDFLVAH